MFVDKIRRAVALLQEAVSEFDPDLLTGQGAADLVGVLAEGERAILAAKAFSARKVERSKIFKRHGHSDAAKWLATETGESTSDAAKLLATVRQMEDLPEVQEAFKNGKLSGAKARQVAGAATVDPSKEKDLLDAAERQTLSELRETCDRVRRQADSEKDEASRYEAIRRRRYFKDFTESDGAVRFDGRVCPDDGAKLRAELMRRARRIAAVARSEGRRERFECYMADALMELVEGVGSGSGSGAGSGGGPEVQITVDAVALRRGWAEASETCEIAGVGQVSVATAIKLLGEGWLSILVKNGIDIMTVANAGRAVPKDVERALRQRDKKCCVPGCQVTEPLERDHRVLAFSDGGPTSLENLALLCKWHHYLKTHRGWSLEGEAGDWQWVRPPEDPDVQGPWGDFREHSMGNGQGSFASGAGGERSP